MYITLKGKNLKIIFRLKFILGIVISCLLTLSVVTYYSIQEQGKQNDKIYSHTIVLYNLEVLVSNILELERLHRSYLYSPSSQNLREYQNAIAALKQSLNVLKGNIIKSKIISEQLVSIERLIEHQLNLMSLPSLRKNIRSISRSSIEDNLLEGKYVVEEILLQTDRIKAYQLKDISQLRKHTVGILYQNYLLVSIFILLTIIILIMAYLFITKELERSLKLSNKLEESIHRLSQSNEELEQFAYVASHDLQEPLRKIIAFIDVIKSKYIDTIPREGQSYFERVVQSSQRLQTLIIDLLNFSRVSKNVGNKKKLNLYTVIHEVVNDLSEVVKEKEAIISFKLSKKLFVEATEIQMRQLFQNIVSNALKFTKQNIRPEIEISSSMVKAGILEKDIKILTSEKYILIKIKDNGIGFDENYLNKIFTIFQRLHSQGEYSGTGIGLALCKRICENHNGFLDAKSNLGKGAVFYVYLPEFVEKKPDVDPLN